MADLGVAQQPSVEVEDLQHRLLVDPAGAEQDADPDVGAEAVREVASRSSRRRGPSPATRSIGQRASGEGARADRALEQAADAGRASAERPRPSRCSMVEDAGHVGRDQQPRAALAREQVGVAVRQPGAVPVAGDVRRLPRLGPQQAGDLGGVRRGRVGGVRPSRRHLARLGQVGAGHQPDGDHRGEHRRAEGVVDEEAEHRDQQDRARRHVER